MTTHRKLFSYDSLEDADIHEFFQSLPDRQASKYIRIAIRKLMKEMEEKGEISPISKSSTSSTESKEENTKAQHQESSNDTFIDNDDILNLGK